MAGADDHARLERLTAFLRDPATHELPHRAVSEPIETHGAVVVLAGDRAYKLKKPVDLPYMDLSTIERRQRVCRREVELNRRTAPDLYLGVGTVAAGSDGRWHLRGPDEALAPGEALVEPLVVMRRFDEEALFDRLAERGELTDRDLDALAAATARAHAEAPISRARAGSARVADVLAINQAGIESGVPAVFDAASYRDAVDRAAAAAESLAAALDRRGRQGRVRRCHGDLHLRNVFRGEDGQPVLFDALEFDEDLATVDVAYDLAFLLMDLRHRGLAAGANRVWNGWLAATRDDRAAAAMPLFMSMRAAVRAHVGATAATQHGLDSGKAAEARDYLEESRRYLDAASPIVVAIGGISGTGKTTLARAVAPLLGVAPGAVVLRSDVIRKRRFGVAENDRLPSDAYGPQVSRLVYTEMHRRARSLGSLGVAVIADGVYGRPEDRRAIAAAARSAGVPFIGVWLELPAAVAKARVDRRTGDASDATAAVVDRQSAEIKPPGDWLLLDASQPVDMLAAEIFAVSAHRLIWLNSERGPTLYR